MAKSCKNSRLDNILESILKFLQYDVRTLFGPAANMICNMKSCVGSEKELIEHSYGCRPNICNGEAEEEEDPDFMDLEWCLPIVEPPDECCTKKQKQIQNCSKQMEEEICENDFDDDDIEEVLCCSEEDDEDDIDLDNCQNECATKTSTNNTCKKESKVKNICQEIYKQIQNKCSTASVKELTHIEKKAQNIWNCMNINDNPSCPSSTAPTWCSLKAGQKLPFYWAALSDDIVTEDPYENFKSFYMPNIPRDKRCTKKTNEQLLIIWHSLATEQKMPFIMEAFIGKIGGGKVNVCDEHEIQRVMKRLQRNCT